MAIVYIFICLSSKVALFQIASISPVIECCVNLEIFKYMNLSLDGNIPWQPQDLVVVLKSGRKLLIPQFSSTVIKDVTMIGAIGKAVDCGVSWIKEDVTRDNLDGSPKSFHHRERLGCDTKHTSACKNRRIMGFRRPGGIDILVSIWNWMMWPTGSSARLVWGEGGLWSLELRNLNNK